MTSAAAAHEQGRVSLLPLTNAELAFRFLQNSAEKRIKFWLMGLPSITERTVSIGNERNPQSPLADGTMHANDAEYRKGEEPGQLGK